MKFLSYLLILQLITIELAYAQIASSVLVNDTRNTNEPPGNYGQGVRFDFKYRAAVGVPGLNNFSGMMSLTPWNDSTGDKVHQLNFNNGGMYYRQGAHGHMWEGWQKILTDNGVQQINGPLELHYDDAPLSFVSTIDNSWQYINFMNPKGRRAYMGITPTNDFNIVRENGGNILLLGANVGIGTTNPGTYRLAVEGTLGARKIKVTQSSWADFVFDDNYDLPSLKEVHRYIKANKHLPDIPSAQDVHEQGLDIGEMNKKLLQKLEELTLYIINQDKKLEKQDSVIKSIQTELIKFKVSQQ